jgi:uncharacterized membrane protein YecN with MAPEG domain
MVAVHWRRLNVLMQGSAIGGEDKMTMPAITATYLGVLGLLYAFLGLRVARMRRGNKIGFGDGDNVYLRSAIRAHAHFAEYVPIIVIMNALLEMGGASPAQMHVLLGTLTVSRVLHPFGMHAKPMTPQFIVGRIVGMILTVLVLVASALLLLRRFALPTS